MPTHRAPPASQTKVHRAPPAIIARMRRVPPAASISGTVQLPVGLNEAFERLKHYGTLYLDGVYKIKEPLRCTNKISVTIYGNHSRIIADPGFPADQPMLDCCGTFNSTFYDLRLETAEGSKPKAGLVIGRNPDMPGGKCLFSNMHIKGTYGVSPYYNCGGELHTFVNCLFKSDNIQPAYVDTSLDFAKLTGWPDKEKDVISNVCKRFYACTFRNGVLTAPFKGGVQLVKLYRTSEDISFRDCYFATGPHPGSTVIDLTPPSKAQTFNLLIDGGRVEGAAGAPPEVKALYDPRGVRLLRIARPCYDARIVDLRYTIYSDYVMRIEGNGQWVNSSLSISRQLDNNAPLIEDTRP